MMQCTDCGEERVWFVLEDRRDPFWQLWVCRRGHYFDVHLADPEEEYEAYVEDAHGNVFWAADLVGVPWCWDCDTWHGRFSCPVWEAMMDSWAMEMEDD